MNFVEAVYVGGVFKPLAPVPLTENQKVELHFRPVERKSPLEWLREVQDYQRRIIETRGYFPDSTPDIAEDRRQ